MKQLYFGLAFVFLGSLSSSGPARACLNDRDSDALALQAKQLPDTVRVITGRFPRNPPLFYRMRIQHSKAELAKNPKEWGLYDDIGVALDKINKDGEALRWMAAKKQQLPPYDAKNPAVKEAWYRYYANDGTFRVHRWLKLGGSMRRIGELRQARNEIARAIKIKPNAHFGRERYQLFAMEWIGANKGKKNPEALSTYLANHDDWEQGDGNDVLVEPLDKYPHQDRAIDGLSGLIVLGGAWESPDVFEALARALHQERSSGLEYFADLRCQELIREHRPTIALGGDYWERELILPPEDFAWTTKGSNPARMRKLFANLRREADAWQAARTAFMLRRLKAGRHPDWDAHFWEGYKEKPAPKMDEGWGNWSYRGPADGPWAPVALAIFALGAFTAGVVLLRKLHGARGTK